MDDELDKKLAAINAADTPEKVRERARRYRARRKAEMTIPRDASRDAKRASRSPAMAGALPVTVLASRRLPDSAENSFPWECSWCDFIQPRQRGRNWYDRSLSSAERHLSQKHPVD